jgi:hypothetical protein
MNRANSRATACQARYFDLAFCKVRAAKVHVLASTVEDEGASSWTTSLDEQGRTTPFISRPRRSRWPMTASISVTECWRWTTLCFDWRCAARRPIFLDHSWIQN